jgi:hypothetical protein
MKIEEGSLLQLLDSVFFHRIFDALDHRCEFRKV